MTHILFLLRRPSDLSLLKMPSLDPDARIIAASDDPLLYALAKENNYVHKVTFIEKMHSVYPYIESIQKIRETINCWLTKDSSGFPPYLLEWENCAEGGDTTQKIQDLVLLIQSYKELLSDNHVTKIVLNRSRESCWEDDVLIQTAKNLGIQILQKKGIRFRLFRLIQGRIRGNARLLYWIGRVFVSRFFKYDSVENRTKKIVFLLESSVDKHVNNILPSMREFSKRKGYEPIALCWSAFDGSKKIIAQGLKADNLECWCPLISLPYIILCYFKTRWRGWANFNTSKRLEPLTYQGVDLNELITPFIKRFLQESLMYRVMLFFASRNYLSKNSPAAVKAWGNNVLDYGRIFYKAMEAQSKQSGHSKPIVFFFAMGLVFEDPYPYHPEKSDLIFVAGEIDKKNEAKDLSSKSKIIVSGFSRSSELMEFKKKYSAEKSRKILGIPADFKYTIFFPSPLVVRGLHSAQERNIVIFKLLEFVKLKPEISIIIKPYPVKLCPTESLFFLQELIARFGNPKNVFLTDRNISPYHCINISDFMIAKLSTLILEAMEFEKPVISVVLDNEPRFLDIFGESAEKITSLSALTVLVNQITSDHSLFSSWSQSRLEKQKEFLPKKNYPNKIPVERVIVNEVIKML